MSIERAFLRLINNTIIRIVAKRATAPIMLPMSANLVNWLVLELLLVLLPEVGVCPVFVFCEETSAVAAIVGVKIGVATAVVAAVGDRCCVGVGSDAGGGVGDGEGVGVGVRAL
jgi:hypothetical protein